MAKEVVWTKIILKKQATKSAITFNAPIIGAITLDEQDVDKLYKLIRNEY